jgi:ElaB/YqjD/DUF883 family membrane-anchored ribosome-binding protein
MNVNATQAIDQAADLAGALADGAAHNAEQMMASAKRMANDTAESVQSGLNSVRDSAKQMSERTADFIRDEPMKALMMAAAAGAVTALLVTWLNRPADRSCNRGV